ncbi:MAG TPA: hypothetical protein VMG74_01830 [Gaiellaceae bacterium]|nr:hypothetical protein [Gaiellaceae bacterium]HUJ55686.1 hypothetical protein [Gaiellaceae bacterium]
MSAALLERPAAAPRRSHQARVTALLDAIEERRRRLYRAQANGLRPAAVRELKAELKGIRAALAETLEARPS